MNPSLKALENQYLLLTNNLPALIVACKDDCTLKDNLMTSYVTSRRNYWDGIKAIFHDDDPAVHALVTQMTADQISLDATIQNLGKIAKILAAITKAVDVGSQLLAKATKIF